MLYLIGTGLYYLNDLPFRAINILRSCREAYLETYTNLIDTRSLALIEKEIGKKITLAGREEIEAETLVEKAVSEDVCLLVPGDPLSATTHLALILSCKEKGIDYEIIHAGSIFTAVAETGLSAYRFGAAASMPIYRENYSPTSFFDVIENNIKSGLHTLVLLEAERKDRFLGVEEAVDRLKKIEKERRLQIICWEKVIAVSKLGSRESSIWMVNDDIEKKREPPFSIVIPGRLSRLEEEAMLKLLH